MVLSHLPSCPVRQGTPASCCQPSRVARTMVVLWLQMWQPGHLMKLLQSFFSSSSKPPSLANFLVVTAVVSIGFVSPALGIFPHYLVLLWRVAGVSSAQGLSPTWQCRSARTNFKASWDFFPSLSIVFSFSPWSLHHVLKAKLVTMEKNDVRLLTSF